MEPADVVLAFAKDMSYWERQCKDAYEKAKAGATTFKQFDETMMLPYREICARYCVEGKGSWRQSVNFQEPPEYDPDSLILINSTVSGKKAEVIVRDKRWGFISVYKLERFDEVWKLVSRQQQAMDGKRSRAYF